MMNEKQVPIEDLRAAVQEILYTVSGAYCSEFWDGMREVCDDLDNVKAIKKTIELLHTSGHDIFMSGQGQCTFHQNATADKENLKE